MLFPKLLKMLPLAPLVLVVCTSTQAQEMPPGGIIVNTTCTMAEGHTLDEVLQAARAIEYSDDGANFVFYRRPIGGGSFEPGFVLRTVYWDSVAHWAEGGSNPPSQQSRARRQLNELLDCDNSNRSFWTNRNVNQGNAYAGGANQDTLMAARRCRMKPGSTLEQFYTNLQELDAPYAQQGDTTLMQLSQEFIGPSNGQDMGTLVTVRLVGENAMGLARRLDMSTKYVGTPDDAAVESCGNWVLFSSHIAHWGGL